MHTFLIVEAHISADGQVGMEHTVETDLLQAQCRVRLIQASARTFGVEKQTAVELFSYEAQINVTRLPVFPRT